MNEQQLRQLEVSSLIIFCAVLRLRNAKLVAEQLKVRPSAISSCLVHLRSIFNDPLFYHKAEVFQPTALALEIGPKIQAAVNELLDIAEEPNKDSTADLTRTFRVAADGITTGVLYAPVLNYLRHEAPRSRLSWQSLERLPAVVALDREEIDIAIGFYEDLPQELISSVVHSDRLVLVGSKTNEWLKQPLDRDMYSKLSHLSISPSGDNTDPIDSILKRFRLKRDVVGSAPNVEAACAAVVDSNLVVTMPNTIARQQLNRFELKIIDLPFKAPAPDLVMVRRRSSIPDRNVDWVARKIRRVLQSLIEGSEDDRPKADNEAQLKSNTPLPNSDL